MKSLIKKNIELIATVVIIAVSIAVTVVAVPVDSQFAKEVQKMEKNRIACI